MIKRLLVAMVGCALPAMLGAQTASPGNAPPASDAATIAQAAPAAAPGAPFLASGTPVYFEITDHINTKTAKIGDVFSIRLTEALSLDGHAVMPVGATGKGEIIHAAKARMGGKAGELILVVRYVESGGLRVPLRGFHFGQNGDSHSRTAIWTAAAASAVVPVAAVVGYFIVGGELDVPPGTLGNAKVAVDTSIAPLPVPVQAKP